MNDIHVIYKNSLGLAFLWKRNIATDINRVQIVFKETGLYFNHEELISFKNLIVEASSRANKCTNCPMDGNCKQLLETPFNQISFAVTPQEIEQIKDLIDGTLFQIDMERLLTGFDIK